MNLLFGILSLCVALFSTKKEVSSIRNRCISNSDTTTVFISLTSVLQCREIPKYVFEMSSLKHLSITGMDCDFMVRDEKGNDITQCFMIKEIPAEIAKLNQLKHIQLNVNAIRSIPVELSALKHLKSLDLTDNSGLQDIENVTKLENLEELGLNGCYLSKMPKDIGLLKNLKVLGLAGNNIDKTEQDRIRNLLPNCKITF